MLARSDEDAVVLMTEASILVPALVVLLHRQSSLLWGIRSSSRTVYECVTALLIQTDDQSHGAYHPDDAAIASRHVPTALRQAGSRVPDQQRL